MAKKAKDIENEENFMPLKRGKKGEKPAKDGKKQVSPSVGKKDKGLAYRLAHKQPLDANKRPKGKGKKSVAQKIEEESRYRLILPDNAPIREHPMVVRTLNCEHRGELPWAGVNWTNRTNGAVLYVPLDSELVDRDVTPDDIAVKLFQKELERKAAQAAARKAAR